MSARPRPLEQLRQALELVAEHGSVHNAAVQSGIKYSTLQHTYVAAKQAAERGEFGTDPVIPGFRISQVTNTPNGDFVQQRPQRGPEFDIPAGHVLKGVSALVDQDGRTIQKWIKTRAGDIDPDLLIGLFKDAFADLGSRAPAISAPRKADRNILTVFPLIDWHVGLMAWAKETGEDWDLKIARRTIMDKMRQLIEATPPSGEAIVLGIGDLLHWDGFVQETPASRHPLDGDGRYPKVLDAAADMVEETIELVAARHQKVLVRILRGNHDPVSAVAVAAVLARVFRGHKRITIDNDHGYQWWLRRGKVFLGASHGDKAKMRDMPMLMAADRPEDWAASTYRKVFTGHIHHESRIEEGGVIVESMRSPVAKDAYHSFNKWRAGRSVYSQQFDLDGSMAGSLTFNL